MNQGIISIHAPVWGATSPVSVSITGFINFNSRSRVGSDYCLCFCQNTGIQFQFTLPCGERHWKNTDRTTPLSISIHAPVWGATTLIIYNNTYITISIHAPVWGATSNVLFSKNTTNPISIHAPVWGATPSDYPTVAMNIISIHAPVWGATFQEVDFVDYIVDFNSRSRVGSDLL